MSKDAVTVRLHPQAIAALDELIPSGFFGTKRAEVARSLILDQLKRLATEGKVSFVRGNG